MNLTAKKNFLINLTFSLVISAIIYFAGKFLFKHLFPFVIAFLIAWAVQVPARYISGKVRLNTGTVAAISAVVLYIVAVILVGLIIYLLTFWAKNIIGDIPDFIKNTTVFIDDMKLKVSSAINTVFPSSAGSIDRFFADIGENMRKEIGNIFSHLATEIAKNTPQFLFSSIVALVAGCYISKDFRNLLKFIRSLCGKKIYGNAIKIKGILCNSVLKILKGYLILSFITFLELCLGFWIMRIKYAPILALIISLIDLFPILGTGTILIPWSIIELLTGNQKSGFLLIFIYLVITLIRNFLEPKIIGKQIGIHPLFTLIAMFVGFKLIGFWGLFLFPIAFIVVIKYYKNEMENEAI